MGNRDVDLLPHHQEARKTVMLEERVLQTGTCRDESGTSLTGGGDQLYTFPCTEPQFPPLSNGANSSKLVRTA